MSYIFSAGKGKSYLQDDWTYFTTQKYESDKQYATVNTGGDKVSYLASTIPSDTTVSEFLEWELGTEAISQTFYLGVDKTKSPTKIVYMGDFSYSEDGGFEGGKINASQMIAINGSTNTSISYYAKYQDPIKVSANSFYGPGQDELAEVQVTPVSGFLDSFSKYFPKGWQENPFGLNVINDPSEKLGSQTPITTSSSSYDKYYSDLTSGNASLTSKKINWKTFSDFSSADSSFYSALEWGSVNINKLQKFQGSSIDWTQVQYSEFSTKQYKQTNWSQVSISSFTSEQYQAIDWGRVNYRGAKSISYSQVSWSEVDFGDFSVKTFKKVDWSKVQTADLTTEQYSDINWSQVKFKGSKAPTLSDLDLSLVIGSSSFSKKTAKQIDWSTVSTDDISSSALSKLSGLGLKKKGTNVAELLKPGTQSKELSFAGVVQAEGGVLTTGQESSGSGAEVLLAAVEKQPALV